MLVIQQDYLSTTGAAKGFQMTFENGNTISVMFGKGNYCNTPEFEKDRTSNKTAEVAIWDKNGNWYNFGNDTVKGWCNSNEVAEFIQFAANWTF